MTISRRLVLLVSIPLAVALAFAVLGLVPATTQTIQAHRLTTMAEVAGSAARLTHRLQDERTAATALVAGESEARDFAERAGETDAAVRDFRARSADLSSVPGKAQSALQRVESSLEHLPSLRAQARSGNSSLSSLAFGYRIAVADLIDFRDGIALSDGVSATTADHIRAAASLSRAGEHLARQQVVVLRAMSSGGFTPASKRSFEATRLGYADSVRVLFDIGKQEWRTWFESTLSGPETLAARGLEDRAGRAEPGRELGIPGGDWQKATAERIELLRVIEQRVGVDVHQDVVDSRDALAWWAVAQVGLVLLTLVVVVLIAVRSGRLMIRRLRDLRNAAHDVAHVRLPKVVTELSQPGALSGASPEEMAMASGRPVTTTGRDEIGEVGEAFNAVHYEAVRLAARQALFHEKFAETLVGVARRGAQLTSVMVTELDAVQRDEADPERMKALFALDHLAVRMERNTNNLLVLGGYGHGRVRVDDVPCSTVIVAAAQQIERFDRVELGIVEPGIGIAARVVHDVAHILAELLDNATRYSPPDKRVGVAVWRLWDRAVLQVVDEGVGINADRRARLNAALAEPPTELGDVRSMGLHVVARLAARHGISVELRDSAGPGTIAEVTLPHSVLADVSAKEAAREEAALRPLIATASRETTDERATVAVAAVGARNASGGGTADASGGGTTSDDSRKGTTTGVRGTGRRDEPAERTTGGTDTPATGRGPGGARRTPGPDPAAQRVTRYSAAGLPVRQRRGVPDRPGPGRRGDDTLLRPAAAARPAKPAPRQRDSRQISDVLAAYTQGINRSTSRRQRPTGAETIRSGTDDHSNGAPR
ncbi:nitrate- and nitrite sensing domain-containing protein [Streptomyces sp. JJ38]|uniref:sensor histidine kinase n=1 Tax=Streptomyces sp. JJ38 TaxID=2738128 RepID=UPI001C56FA10|nr:nitrate- and nitrite sensing domain-containing protein [Streptomyces sp. JJ38]MBW1599216.1 sensor histidine kinase [Streptomyces sp. JJ38]